MQKYSFKKIKHCKMCGADTGNHKILGQRLNKSQGFNPKNKIGISVSIQQCRKCELIYPNPLPIPENIQDHYGTPPEDYWIESYFNWTEDYFSFEINEALELISHHGDMKALDIGAGIGKAMKSLEAKGFKTYGLEPSTPFYNRAIERMNIPKDNKHI